MSYLTLNEEKQAVDKHIAELEKEKRAPRKAVEREEVIFWQKR